MLLFLSYKTNIKHFLCYRYEAYIFKFLYFIYLLGQVVDQIEYVQIPNDQQNQYYEKFIGQKYLKYFQKHFAEINEKKAFSGFNIAAFFLGVFWLLYRKMYLYSGIYILLMILFCFIPIPDSFARAIGVGFAVTMGWSGNGLYKYFVDQKIKKIQMTHSGNIEQQLKQQGGTDIHAPIGLFIVLSVLFWIAANFP